MTTSNQARAELREKFERWWEINYHNGNPPRFGWERWRDGDGYQIDDDESELDGMWESWQAAHSEKLEAAEKRIAELEARQVNEEVSDEELNSALQLHGLKVDGHSQLSDAFRAGFKYARRAAGITVKGELPGGASE